MNIIITILVSIKIMFQSCLFRTSFPKKYILCPELFAAFLLCSKLLFLKFFTTPCFKITIFEKSFQTAYLIFFCSETHYEKCLKKVARFVVEQNEQVSQSDRQSLLFLSQNLIDDWLELSYGQF